MLSFIPRMILAPEPASTLRAKFGGLPYGLSSERWPSCRECGLPMSSIAQIPVRGHLDRAALLSERPDLADRVLHVFTCERPSICSFWDPELGANAAFLVPESELAAVAPAREASEAPVQPEVWIEDWSEHRDALTDNVADSYFDNERFFALPEEQQVPHDFDFALTTKLGGLPYWTANGPGWERFEPFRYLMQIDKFLPVPEAEGELVDLGNFCSDGTGYVFVDLDGPEPHARFQINR